ncbi:MAG: ABC transporter permease [Acidimicrobiia bacterium]|nr:ABC transporter permease [Acidimicrobiia bacterium]
MNSLQTIFLVAGRDFSQRIRSRVFLISMAIMMLLILGLGPLMASQIEAATSAATVGVIGQPPYAAALSESADALGIDIEVVPVSSRSAGETMLSDGALEVLLAGNETIWQRSVSPSLNALVLTAAQATAQQEAITTLGLSNEEAMSLLAPALPKSVVLEPPDDDAAVREGLAFFGVVVLFMAVVLSGQFVLLGVMEEKSSRVAEVVLARLRPMQLLTGKVIGIGALGLLQLSVLGGSLYALTRMVDLDAIPGLGTWTGPMIGSLIMWFLLGYAMYSVLYATAGSLVTRQEDVQSVSWIPMLGLLPGYFIALIVSEDPESTLATVASIVPISAPMVMPVRAAGANVPGWQYGLAVALSIVTAYLLMMAAGRVYRGSMLRTSKTKIRDAWRAAGPSRPQ